MSRSQQTKDDRLIVPKRPVPYPLAAVPVVVTLVVVTALVAAATGALAWLPRGVLAIYFPPFLVTGSPDLRLVGFAIFLVLTAFLLYRRKYWSALAALALPVAFTWLFAWRLMGD